MGKKTRSLSVPIRKSDSTAKQGSKKSKRSDGNSDQSPIASSVNQQRPQQSTSKKMSSKGSKTGKINLSSQPTRSRSQSLGTAPHQSTRAHSKTGPKRAKSDPKLRKTKNQK